ncbi:MAG: leucyl aminopeptidase [Nocardioides sp.]
MTSFSLRSANPARTRADVVVVGVVQVRASVELAEGGAEVAKAYGRRLRPLLSSLGVKAGVGEITRITTAGTINAPLLILVGLGRESEVTTAVVRRAAGAASRAITNAASVAVALPTHGSEWIQALAEGWALGAYTFDDYRKTPTPDRPGSVVLLCGGARQQSYADALTRAEVVTQAVLHTRDWVNTPPGDLRPPDFATAASTAVEDARKHLDKAAKLSVRVLEEDQLEDLGAGGILGVGRGSGAPPRLVEIEYVPAQTRRHVALVGKGITFDSGGLTIKPATSLPTMKSDMAGAAAVITATLAIARLGLPVRVSAFAPMAENMISGDATRPGDVLTMLDGTTVEVRNTDAEGRLALADALVRATRAEPDLIIDVATLTGHMSLSLGDRVGAIFGDDDLVSAVVEAGTRVGEKHWPMPITEEVEQRLAASPIADLLQHDWVRWGGGLMAAGFLREFTGGVPWAHLDIAGPAYLSSGPTGHLTAGATGFGVATLIEYARQLGER